MPVTANHALDKLRNGQLVFGLLVRLNCTIEMARVAEACDHDFLFLDMQHAGMSMETATKVCHAALGTTVTPLVRVPAKQAHEAPRLLDNGAMGIVAPDVETAEEARHLVSVCRFPPLGRRSVAAGYPQFGYEPMPIADACRLHNRNTMLVAMIESGKGVENADEIVAVEGIDVVHVGSNDLLAEMGIPEQIGTERHYELVAKVGGACRAHGRFFGAGGARSPEQQAKMVELGARFMTTNSDLAFLLAAAGERAKFLRSLDLGPDLGPDLS